MQGRLEQALGLTQAQLAEIEELAEACDRAEGLTMRLNWSSLRRRPSDRVNDFLYYDRDRLVGFLGLYVFGDEPQEAEVTAMTHPENRRQGIFRRLLAEAQTEVARRKIPSLLFFGQNTSPASRPVMQAIGATYEHSEYKMIARVEAVRQGTGGPDVVLRPATEDEVPELARMQEEAFGMSGAEGWLRDMMADRHQFVWSVALVPHQGTCSVSHGVSIVPGLPKSCPDVALDDRPVGVIQGSVGEEENHIYGFCMKPEYRGKGFGKAALAQAMEQLLATSRQPISLEVEARNEGALGLYRSRGFEAVTAYDYYRLPVDHTGV